MSCTLFLVLFSSANVTNSEEKKLKHFDQQEFKTQLKQVSDKPEKSYEDLLNEYENQLDEHSDRFNEPENEVYPISNGFKEPVNEIIEHPNGFVGGKVGCRWVRKCINTRYIPMCWWAKYCTQMG